MKERDKEAQLPGWVYVVLVVIIAFVVCRYGWKVFGFSQCGAGYYIEQVEVLENTVHISGISSNQNPIGGFVGYKTEQIGNVLYVGLKHNVLLGVLPTDKNTFDYHIKTVGTVDKVVLRAGEKTTVVYGETNSDQMTVRVRVKGVYMDELGYAVLYDGNVIASGGVKLNNENDLILPFVFMKSDFEENADMQKFALRFTLRGSEQEIVLDDPIYPGITFGEETEVILQATENGVEVMK